MYRAVALALLLLLDLATGQDDLRDVVRTTDGKETRGRVLTPFHNPTAGDKDEVVVMQGGKRVRLLRKDVATMDLVPERVRQFLERRAQHPDNAAMAWILVQWAQSRELPHLARLQALELALRSDDHERAHEYLGHKKGSKGWQWELDGKWLPRDQFLGQWGGRKTELRGEHFLARAEGGFAATVSALLDLETLYQWWLREFGPALRMTAVLEPMLVEISRNGETFPKWGFRPMPYFVPHPHGEAARTYYGVDPERPRLLFFTGSQAILYRAVATNVTMPNERDRICPWLEIAFGMLAESTLQGPPGRAQPGPLRHQDLQAMAALGRSFKLANLLHLPMYGGYYLMDDSATAINWSASETLAAFLLGRERKPSLRENFLEYVRQVFVERKGDGSSTFDRVLGVRIETLEPELQAWLNKQAGF